MAAETFLGMCTENFEFGKNQSESESEFEIFGYQIWDPNLIRNTSYSAQLVKSNLDWIPDQIQIWAQKPHNPSGLYVCPTNFFMLAISLKFYTDTTKIFEEIKSSQKTHSLIIQ